MTEDRTQNTEDKIEDYNSSRTRSGSSVVFAEIDVAALALALALRRLSLRSARFDGYQDDADREAEAETETEAEIGIEGGEKDWFLDDPDPDPDPGPKCESGPGLGD